ncbi:MAG: helix-turn-helix transcriptional regulator [Chloroflexota bacterium]|nr:helix-turn-helix transcriptional regulator [Chloroflexota bacterium]
MTADDARRMGDALGRVVARGHDVTGFFEATGSVLRRSIPFDGFCSMTVDPATMLLTSHIVHDSVRPQDVPALGRNEFLEDDVNKFAVLARAPRPAGVLTQATAGQPESSPRFREILRPNGFADELRFTLLDGDECWGWVALYRREGSGRFDDAEATLAAAASQLLAEGLRRAILLEVAPGDEGPDAPGLILLTAGGEIEAVTPPAERWLAALITSEAAEGKLPPVVNNVAYRALLAARSDRATGAARAHVSTSGGGWLAIHGSVLGDPADGRIAIILEPAKAPEMAPLIVAAYGLSAREREVTELVLHGLSTTEISQRLHVSAYTVQDHLKAIFDKVAVRSRRELVARIFSEHYMPRLQSGTRPVPAGWFAAPLGDRDHEAPTNQSQ